MHNKKWSHKCPSVKERPRESVVFGCLSQQIPRASPPPWDVILNFFSPKKHEILILYIDARRVYFDFFKQQLISRTLENGCAICRRNRLLTCTASSTDKLQSPSFRYSWIQRGILLRLSARANLWTKINKIITTKARWYHLWWRVFKYCGEDKSAF